MAAITTKNKRTYWLQSLLDLGIQSTGLDGDDGRGRIRIMGNGGAALGAEDAMHGLARRSLACPALGGTVDGEFVLEDYGNQSCKRGRNVSQ